MSEQREIQIAGHRVSPGTRTHGRFSATRLLSGGILSIPIHIIHGTEPGPVVGITAAIHGGEHVPIRMIKGALEQITPTRLRGTILAVPICNPLAFAWGTRITPNEEDVDFANLNRVFPGRRTRAVFGLGQPPPSDRTLTEALAALIAEEFVPRITHLIDFHCHSHGAGLIKTIQKVTQEKQPDDVTQGMCRALGLGLIHEHATDVRTLTGFAGSMGVHTCVAEVGGGGISARGESRAIQIGIRGILNVLRFLGLIDGEMELPDRQLLFRIAPHMRPTTAGYLVSHYDPDELFIHDETGVPVKRDQILGEIFDPYTFEDLETIRAPVDGILYITRRSGPVEAGSHAFAVADFEMSRWVQ